MARRKTLPDSVRAKYELAERLSTLRAELFGERGGPELARQLGLPIRTWYNYESGVTVPAEVVLKIIELTAVEPMWLLHGRGPKFRPPGPERAEAAGGPVPSVGALLRTALQLLEQRQEAVARTGGGAPRGLGHRDDGDPEHAGAPADVVLIGVDDTPGEPLTRTSGPRYVAARGEWLDAERDCRCIRVVGGAMAPIVADGAYVAFAKAEDPVADLNGKLVVAWLDGQPVVRWFEHHGRFGLLRAENPAAEPPQVVIDLEDRPARYRIRRVLWINTPH